MSRTKRVIIVMALIQLLLAGIWIYLAHLAATSAGAHPDAQRVIGQTMGSAMGLLLGLTIPLYFLARVNDRKAAARKGE